MRTEHIPEILKTAFDIRDKGGMLYPCFVSAPGLAKTFSVKKFAQDNGLGLVILSCSTLEPPDFRGFPDKIEVDGKARLDFATPIFWPSSGKGIILLEELNRSPSSIMQCVLSLTDIRRGFDNYTLPEGWIVVANINAEDSVYETASLDPALKDRLEFFNVEFHKDSFVSFIKAAGWNKTLIRFIESGIWKFIDPESVGNIPGSKYISPRTLSRFNDYLESKSDEKFKQTFYTSILGVSVAKDFSDFENDHTILLYKDFLANKKEALAKLKAFSNVENMESQKLHIFITDLLDQESVPDKHLAEVLRVIPADQSLGLLKALEDKTKDYTISTKLLKDFPFLKDIIRPAVKYMTSEAKSSSSSSS